MNVFNIERSFKIMKERGWDTLWWAIDLHHTIFEGNYKESQTFGKFYPDAKKVLQFLTKKKDFVLILSTSSHSKVINDIIQTLSKHHIHFDYVNCNLDVKSNKLSNFDDKYYFNVMLDDKAGFEGETDWTLVKKELEKEYGVIIK